MGGQKRKQTSESTGNSCWVYVLGDRHGEDCLVTVDIPLGVGENILESDEGEGLGP